MMVWTYKKNAREWLKVYLRSERDMGWVKECTSNVIGDMIKGVVIGKDGGLSVTAIPLS